MIIEHVEAQVVAQPIVVESIECVQSGCSCIVTAREYGIDIPIGTNASDFIPNSVPVVGGLILLSYPNDDHIAVIVEFRDDGFWVYEGNFEPGVQGYRLISYKDLSIRGFWIQGDN